MNKTLYLLFIAISIILLSSACQTNIPTITPTASATVEKAATLTPSEIITVTPSQTAYPTQTQYEVATRTVTLAPTLILNSGETGLITTMGEGTNGPSYTGYPIFSPDGKYIALASRHFSIWDLPSGKLVQEFKNPCENCVFEKPVFSPDGKLLAAFSSCNQLYDQGCIYIWDFASGDLIIKWKTEIAHMPETTPDGGDYYIPVQSLAFFPDSTSVIYASGTTLEIRNVYDEENRDVIKLGSKMFASQLSLSPDGKLAYIVMNWRKDHDFPVYWKEKYRFQVWNIKNHFLVRENNYPEGWVNIDLNLVGKYLVTTNFNDFTSQVTDLETEDVRDIPLRHGWRYYNSDVSLAIFANIFTPSEEDEHTLELWYTDNWRNLYTFEPDFQLNWVYTFGYIAFSPDNKTLALTHNEQVSLWNIAPVIPEK